MNEDRELELDARLAVLEGTVALLLGRLLQAEPDSASEFLAYVRAGTERRPRPVTLRVGSERVNEVIIHHLDVLLASAVEAARTLPPAARRTDGAS